MNDAAESPVLADGRVAGQRADPRSGTRPPGRRPKLSREQQAAIVDAVRSGQSTAAQMARCYKVSEPTVSRILAAVRVTGEAPAGEAPAGEAPAGEAPGDERIVGILPVAALDERLAIVGTAGSGKTYATKGLVERLMQDGARVCVVDPLGVWWGLRLAADGTTPASLPVVVFGGRHADIALAPGMGAALGRLVATQPLACVVDVSDLGSAPARRSFMTAFTESLYDSNTEPLHLVLDEADLWAPQRVQLDGYDLLGRIEEIVRRGRVRGFVPWLVTQRPAVLHKDVLSQADILVSLKLTSSQDRAAVGRWIEGQADQAEGRRILAELPRLGRGEGWVWAPSGGVLARVAFPRIRTFDSSAAPRRAERLQVAAPAPVDLPALAAALAGRWTGKGRADLLAHGQMFTLEQRLQQREQELASALIEIAALKAAIQAR
jgi:hypothetical protein